MGRKNVFFYFTFPRCIHHNGQKESSRLPLIFIASLCYVGQQHLLYNLLVPVSSAVPSTQDMQTFCTSEVGVSWFQMPGVHQGPQYTQNSQSLSFTLTLRSASPTCMHRPSDWSQTKGLVWNPTSSTFWIAPLWAVSMCVLPQCGSFGLHAQPVKTEMVKEKQIMSEWLKAEWERSEAKCSIFAFIFISSQIYRRSREM